MDQSQGSQGYKKRMEQRALTSGFTPRRTMEYIFRGRISNSGPVTKKTDDNIIQGKGKAQQPAGQYRRQNHGQNDPKKSLKFSGAQIPGRINHCGSNPLMRA